MALFNSGPGLFILWCPTDGELISLFPWVGVGMDPWPIALDSVDMRSNFGKTSKPFGCDLYLVSEK